MSRCLLLLALACGPEAPPAGAPSAGEADTDADADADADTDADTDAAGDTGTEALPQPVLPPVAEAEDLDPAEDVVRIALTAAPATHSLTHWRTGETRTVDGYAYNGQVPGPTIRAKVGDTVVVELDNQLDAPTTIHWHGLGVPWAMDGVTWMADPVAPGETFTYTFPVARAGTYWYHPHFDTVHQVDRGLYGVLVVEDPAEPAADRDLVVVLDDWAQEQGLAAYADEVHGALGEEGWWTANGAVDPALAVTGGETLRLRLLNASNHGYLDLSLDGDPGAARLLARDQGLLARAADLDAEVLAPGDRIELEVRPGEVDLALRDAPYSLNGGQALGEAETRLDLVLADPAAAAGPLDWPTSGQAPTPDPGRTDITWTFQGSIHGDDWMINGEHFPEVTIPRVALGEEFIVEVRNLSATEHPFHQHGLHFEVLSLDEVAPPTRTVEDTLNLPLYARARLRLVADNPGDWMTHCHILPHATGGMMTVLRVAEP